MDHRWGGNELFGMHVNLVYKVCDAQQQEEAKKNKQKKNNSNKLSTFNQIKEIIYVCHLNLDLETRVF